MIAATGDNDSESQIDTVGVIGAGRVGQWFVTKLVQAGYNPVIFDISPEAVADAADCGAAVGEHPADVADQADVIVLSLPTQEAVETVMEGDNGILNTLDSGRLLSIPGRPRPVLMFTIRISAMKVKRDTSTAVLLVMDPTRSIRVMNRHI